MKPTQSTHRAALAIGVAGASLIYMAGGLVIAGDGYMMKEHPLRGDFPLASGDAAPSFLTHGNGGIADAKSGARAQNSQAANRGDWLRGDFPKAAAVHPDPVQVTRVGEGVALTADLQIPGLTRLRIEELTFQPGAAVDPFTMDTAFVCEMVQGELEATVDIASVKRSGGDVWPCPTDQFSALHTNTGTTPAVMRVFHRIPQ